MSTTDSHLPASAAAHLSGAQLRQYAAGTLTAAQRREVERHTLACPLCADALEGFQLAAPAAVAPAALAALHERLQARVQQPQLVAERGGAWWWAAAAAVALLLTVVGLWQWRQPAPVPDVAINTQPERVQRPAAPPAPTPAATPAPAPAESAPAASVASAPAVAAAPASPRRRTAARSAAASWPAVAAVEVDGLDATSAAADLASAEVAAAPASPAAAPPVPEASSERSIIAAAAPAAKSQLAARVADEPATSLPAAGEVEEAAKRKAALPAVSDLAPFPAGGYPALRTYLRREQFRPSGELGSQSRAEGVVKLKFMVEADGSVRDIQVVRGINPEYDEEAIRLICEGPAWRPAIVNGRRTAQAVRLDVPFR